MIGYDSSVITDVAEKFTQLRMFLVFHGAFCFSLLFIISRSSHTQDVLSFAVILFACLTLLLLWSYHRTDKAVAVAGGEGESLFKQTEPPCGGVFGQGGAVSSFLCFFMYALLYGSRVFTLWSSCTSKKSAGAQLTSDATTVLVLLLSVIFWLFALFYAELSVFAAKRHAKDGFI